MSQSSFGQLLLCTFNCYIMITGFTPAKWVINVFGVHRCVAAYLLIDTRLVSISKYAATHLCKPNTSLTWLVWSLSSAATPQFYRKFTSVDWVSGEQKNVSCKNINWQWFPRLAHAWDVLWCNIVSVDQIAHGKCDCRTVILAIIFYRSLVSESSVTGLGVYTRRWVYDNITPHSLCYLARVRPVIIITSNLAASRSCGKTSVRLVTRGIEPLFTTMTPPYGYKEGRQEESLRESMTENLIWNQRTFWPHVCSGKQRALSLFTVIFGWSFLPVRSGKRDNSGA